jgi:hypothetical protein
MYMTKAAFRRTDARYWEEDIQQTCSPSLMKRHYVISGYGKILRQRSSFHPTCLLNQLNRILGKMHARFAYICHAESRLSQAQISAMWVRAANSGFGDLSTEAKRGARIVKVAADREVTNL